MESKHKNALIGALLAVVFVMAVGYAAFATTLTINGTAEITTSWDVHFTGDTEAVTATPGTGGTLTPSGTIAFDTDKLVATLTADLKQPGDTVVYTLTPHNYGTVTATAGTPAVTIAKASAPTTALNAGATSFTVGHIQYTVEFTKKPSIAADQDDNAITVTATYTATDDGETVQEQTGGIANAEKNNGEAAVLKVTLVYSQA